MPMSATSAASASRWRNGEDILVDFEKPVHLEQGDRLVLEDGRVAQVVAAPEELMEVAARDQRHLVELAWHIGNRHLARADR